MFDKRENIVRNGFKIQCTSNFYTNHENSGGGSNHDGRIDVNNSMVEQALR